MSEPIKLSEHVLNKRIYIIEFDDGSAKLATENMVPGKRVYGERLYRIGGKEYREWIPYRSKLAAAILKGLKEIPLREGDKVLYLGAATGTTVSHVSDIVGPRGRVYSVEFAPRVMREFLIMANDRANVMPILEDARKPWDYVHLVETVDAIYADVAQPEQAGLIVDNANLFLRRGGTLFFAIKARSVDVTQEPTEIYKREIEILKNGGFQIIDVVHLEPYDKDHAMVLAEYEG
uniref:Fibrillarin-like rRNA/tRNA 2'-O-methyltransferase n=1 Tax=Fervidicoccus fontis TaxID=683846 RepID=A0A7J3ZKN4_9CREN